MNFAKGLFWEPDEVVIQYHPARSDYVNFHQYCLHMWKPQGVELPTPPAILVGPQGTADEAPKRPAIGLVRDRGRTG